MTHWLNQINQLFDANTPFVLATIWSINGTSPDSIGARVVVTESSCYGQLQSSHRQQEIIRQSRLLLSDNNHSWLEKKYSLGDVAGTPNGDYSVVFEKFIATGMYPDWLQILRKSIRDNETPVLANHIDWQNNKVTSRYEVMRNSTDYFNDAENQTRVITKNEISKTLLQRINEPLKSFAVVGSSQITDSLVQQLLLLPVQIQWLIKPGEFTLQAPMLQYIPLNDQAFESLKGGTRIAIASGDHELDIHYCHQALLNPDLPYVGCLGSPRKATIIRTRLTELGISASRLSALFMPIGLESITGKQPSIIAASIVAQLLSEIQEHSG